ATAHITPEIFRMDRQQCHRQGNELLKSLNTIFTQIAQCREEIAKRLQHHIDKDLLDTFLSISFSELNLPDTRVSVRNSQVNSFRVVHIDSHVISIEGLGTVTATFSNGASP